MSHVQKFRKKPVVIEAVQFRKSYEGFEGSAAAISSWTGGKVEMSTTGTTMLVPTLEGVMVANDGDWIIKGVSGEFYPCKPDIFEKTYELVP